MGNEKALGNFIGVLGEARERLAELQEYIDNHMDANPDEVNYGHVGSAEYLLAQLTQLTDWAYNRGEYSDA
jgi:hypothetical protein